MSEARHSPSSWYCSLSLPLPSRWSLSSLAQLMLWVRREAHWAQDSWREAKEGVDWGPGTHRVGGREGRQLKGRHSWVRESLGREVREGARSLHCCLGEGGCLPTDSLQGQRPGEVGEEDTLTVQQTEVGASPCRGQHPARH